MVLMEEKQLNFNQPLLSVRRGSAVTAPPENKRKANNSNTSLPPLPYYKSEINSGPLRHPGVVPFKWERMPGRPKDEKKAHRKTLECPPPAPGLPPGRITNHIPKQKDEIPRDSPANSSPEKVLSEVAGSDKEECKDTSSSEDENVTFVDAQETLSRTESFFNCSVSGVSGLDGPELSLFFSDPQTRDLMMGRFLPAAKAVASETPPITSRRNHVTREQEKPVQKMIKWKKPAPQYNSVPETLQSRFNDKHEDGDDDSDHSDEPEDTSVKLCGLLPRFCMLNPIPGMRDRVEAIPTARSVRTRPCRDSESKVHPNGGGMKRAANQYAPVSSLMNGHDLVGEKLMSPMREKGASPQLFLDREKQLLGLPEFSLAAHLYTAETATLANPATEKTVYVDSERMVESQHSNSSSTESRGRNPSVDYSLQDFKSFCSKSSETTDSGAPIASQDAIEDLKNSLKANDDHEVVNVVVVDVKQPKKPEVKSMTHFKNNNSQHALTPLLPKSPSESWLSRTLPSMGSRVPSSKPYLANYTFRLSSPVEPKRALKNTNVQSMFFKTAGELAPISEN